MATVREGNKGVLLVVDVQAGVMSGSWDASRIIKNVTRAVERARAQSVPVIWVQHSDNELPFGSPGEIVKCCVQGQVRRRFFRGLPISRL